MKLIKLCSLIALLIAAYGIVGSMDYEDELKEQEHACYMVENGHWPKHFCE